MASQNPKSENVKMPETAQVMPLLLISVKNAHSFLRNALFFPKSLSKTVTSLKQDLKEAGTKYTEVEYTCAALVNGLIYGFLFFALFFSLLYAQQKPDAIKMSALLGLLMFMLFFYVILIYPRILAGKRAEQLDKYLLFALKDLSMQVSSGIPIYNALVNVSRAGYGPVSDEFANIAQRTATGDSLPDALEKTAKSTKSVFMKKVTWQLINSLRAGTSVSDALKSIIFNLKADQHSRIEKYAKELNLWILLYMLFAVVVPTLGLTMIILLSIFGGFNISNPFFIFFICLCFAIQIALIGFIKSRRPLVQM